MTSIRFYTRQGCPLCNEALEMLEPIAKKHNRAVEVIDIDLDLALLETYNERVPVIESNGNVIAEGIVDAGSIHAYLTARS